MNTAKIRPAQPAQSGGAPVTLFNAEAAARVPTLPNPEANAPRDIELCEGEMVGGYEVLRPLGAASGEATLYLLSLIHI